MAITRDISLSVSAKISQYQKDMAKLPGVTGKEASKAALRLQSALVKAEQNAAKEAIKAGKKGAKGFASAFSDIQFTIGLDDIKGAISTVSDLVASTTDLRNSITDMGTRTGLANKTLAGLRAAAIGAGREFSDMDEILNPFVGRMGQVRAGSEAAEDSFTTLGVSVRDAEGNFVSNDKVLERIIARIQSTSDASEKAGLAMGLMGEGGGKLTQVLGDIPLDAFVDSAERFGVDVGPEAAESAAAMQRSLAQLSLIAEKTTADFTDMLNVGPNIDAVATGFVFMESIVKDTTGNMIAGLTALSEVMTLQLLPGTQAFEDRLAELGAKGFGQMLEDATKSSQALFDSSQAMKASAEAAIVLSDEVVKVGESHKEAADASRAYAKAQREAEKTDKAREKEIRKQLEAVDALHAASKASAEALLDNRGQITASLDTEIERLKTLKQQAADTALAQVAFTQAVLGAKREAALEMIKIDFEEAVAHQKGLDAEVDATKEANAEKEESDADASSKKLAAIQSGLQLAETVSNIVIQLASAEADQIKSLLDDSMDRQITRIKELEGQRAGASEAENRNITANINQRKAEGKLERDELNKSLKAKRDAALAAFRASQAVALAQAIVSTAAGISRAFADLGPIAGIPAAVIVGAAGTAASVLIATQKPPTFHTGTGRDGATGRASSPGEINATLLEGEGVASQRTMQIEGFGEFLEMMNNQGMGAAGGGGRVVRAVIEQRSMSSAMLQAAVSDGQLGSLLVDRSPGFDPGLA